MNAPCVKWNASNEGISSEDKIKRINEIDTVNDEYSSLLEDTCVDHRLFLIDLEPPTAKKCKKVTSITEIGDNMVFQKIKK